MNNRFVAKFKIVSVGFCMVFLSACATTGALDERDPWEGFNRGVYSFNETVDNVLFDPIGKVYNFITPDFLDAGVSNFFSNIAQVPVIANDLLQFKLGQAVNDTVRLFLNSTFGLFGFFDISSDAGLPSSKADFGQTLALWGVDSGPYLVMPFFGPGTVRHAAGYAVDGALNPMFYIDNDLTKAGLLSLAFVDVKSDLLSAVDLLEEAAVDKYEFTKNAYFEKRSNKINGGEFTDYTEE
jgi:phospholipid-binding lipoprotein MlaA